ncbi:hypothetical protein ES703_90405 [subsurface metagenome]
MRTDIYQSLIPTQRASIPNSQKKDARRFDVDLTGPHIQEVLEHIVKLSMSFIDPMPPLSFAKDFLFIITKDDIGNVPVYEYDKMIGAFDRHRFYAPEEIYSIGIGDGKTRPVKIIMYEDNIKIDPEIIERWKSIRDFLTISSVYMNFGPWW